MLLLVAICVPHETACIRHVSTLRPCVAGDVINLSNVGIVAREDVYHTPEDINLIPRRVIDCDTITDCLRHGRHRIPGVGNAIVAVHRIQYGKQAGRKAASTIKICVIGSACRAFKI